MCSDGIDTVRVNYALTNPRRLKHQYGLANVEFTTEAQAFVHMT